MLIFFIKNSISVTIGPVMLVEGEKKLDFWKKIIEFGAYAMLYVGTDNNMEKRVYQKSS